MPPIAVLQDRIPVRGRDVVIERPSDYDDLLTEEAFDRENLLPYWAHVWDSGVALARAVGDHVRPGDRLLELGCGLGLASVAAARAGAQVTACDWSRSATEATAANAALNDADLRTLTVDWCSPEPLLAGAPWDLVIAADVLYERRQVDVLLDLLPRLGREVLLAEPGRAVAEPFFERAPSAWRMATVSAQDDPRVTVHRLSAR